MIAKDSVENEGYGSEATMTTGSDASAVSGNRTVHVLGDRGGVRDWLVTPSWARECSDLDEVVDPDGDPFGDRGRWVLTKGSDAFALKEALYARHPLLPDCLPPAPVESGEVRLPSPFVAGAEDVGSWKRLRTGEDEFVDWSAFYRRPTYLHAVASTVLETDQSEVRTLRVASTGPFVLWVGGTVANARKEFRYMEPYESVVEVMVRSGATPVHLWSWQVGLRECRQIVRLRVEGLPVRVVIPSPGADEFVSSIAEQLLDELSLESWASREGRAVIRGPVGAALRVATADGSQIALQLADGRGEVRLPTPETGLTDAGETSLDLMVDDARAPVKRHFHTVVLPENTRMTAVGDPQTWASEVIAHAAASLNGTVACELARVWQAAASGHHHIDPSNLSYALDSLGSRADCADFEALGLLALWHRAPLESWSSGMRERTARELVSLRYWIDQPGKDAMCYFTENHQIVWHVAELLAGESFPDDVFPNTGWPGRRHAAHGSLHALAWIRRKLAGGFSEFQSNTYIAIDVLALASVIEFARDSTICAAAEALLDKLLFMLACNSWRGIHGSAHGRSYATMLRSSRFEETSPLMRAAWGLGTLGDSSLPALPAVLLAASRRYQVPELVRAIGEHWDEEWWGREVNRGMLEWQRDLLSRPFESDVRVWRTAYGMLSSVQDYRVGLPGVQEHVWGATLGPESQVFATHPANSQAGERARPNAWAGQRILPRVCQDRDTILAVHRFPADDPMGQSHLWFPTPHFDEIAERGEWMAGRVGDGYVAVTTQGGVEAVRRGEDAYQAFVAPEGGTSWVCTLGDRDRDGSFAEFVHSLTTPIFAPLRVSWVARDGRRLELGWQGAFRVNNIARGIAADGRPESPPHIDNPACRVEFGASDLYARFAGQELHLDLANSRRAGRTGTGTNA